MKNPTRSAVKALLVQRGVNITQRAALAGVSRCHLSEALANKRMPQGGVRGGFTRVRVIPHLTEAERTILGW